VTYQVDKRIEQQQSNAGAKNDRERTLRGIGGQGGMGGGGKTVTGEGWREESKRGKNVGKNPQL